MTGVAVVWIGHLARLALALVYLAAVATKSVDVSYFAEQIAEYGVTPAAWAVWQAPLLLALELVIGVALVVNFRPRLTVPAAAALMLVFIGAISIAWSRGYTGGCGCFGGAVYRTPAATLLEDVLFLGLAGLAYLGAIRRERGSTRHGGHRWQAVAVLLAVVLGLSAPRVAPAIAPPGWATAGVTGGRFDHVVVEEVDARIDHGDLVLALLDPAGDESIAALGPVGDLVGLDGVPPVVGVFQGTNEDMVGVLFEHAPAFDHMGHASRSQLRRFYRELPVVLALRDGEILAAWHDTIPSAEDIASAYR